jgi:hypothetical protein
LQPLFKRKPENEAEKSNIYSIYKFLVLPFHSLRNMAFFQASGGLKAIGKLHEIFKIEVIFVFDDAND